MQIKLDETELSVDRVFQSYNFTNGEADVSTLNVIITENTESIDKYVKMINAAKTITVIPSDNEEVIFNIDKEYDGSSITRNFDDYNTTIQCTLGVKLTEV